MTDGPTPMQPAGRRYWGKYRGKVVDNVDPLAMGRLLIEVPQVAATAVNWAMPCVPYAGFQVGFFAMPEIGANVWVEFEGGNPDSPIWTGCFWDEGEAPIPFSSDPLYKVWKTPGNMLLLDDTPAAGGATLMSEPPAVDEIVTLKFSSEGVLLTAPPAVLEMSIETGITMTFPPGVISMLEEEVSIVIPASDITLTEEGVVITSPDISLDAEAAVEIETPAMDVTVAATEWAGDINLTGAMEVEGDVNVAGAVEVEGNVEVVGAMEIQGEHNILGASQVEGDVNIAGAVQIEGGLVVAGVILEDGMPVMVIPI